jgi:hypothetical protein
MCAKKERRSAEGRGASSPVRSDGPGVRRIRMNSNCSSAEACTFRVRKGHTKEIRYLTEEGGGALSGIGLQLCVPCVPVRASLGEIKRRVRDHHLEQGGVELLLVGHPLEIYSGFRRAKYIKLAKCWCFLLS